MDGERKKLSVARTCVDTRQWGSFVGESREEYTMNATAPIPFAGSMLRGYRHVCAFFSSPQEEYDTLLPFVRDGLDRGERAYHVLPSQYREEHLAQLRSAGIDVAAAQRRRQLEVATPQETYLRGGRFNKDAMLTLIQEALKTGATLGFPLTRLIAHAETVLWHPEDWSVEYLVERYAKKAGKKIRNVKKQTLALFQAYDWPGNVRELQNVIERAVVLCDGDTFAIDEQWLQGKPQQPSKRMARSLTTLAEGEKGLIEAALTASHGRISGPSGAAAKLGIPRQTLESKIKALHIDKVSVRVR